MKIFYFSNKLSIFSKYFEVSDVIEPKTATSSLTYWIDRYSISYGKEKGTSSDEDVPLCPIVTNYRTFVDDMYKVLEFAEWVKEMGDFALLA